MPGMAHADNRLAARVESAICARMVVEEQQRPRPLTARQAERRERILKAAEFLVGRDGYDAVTMRMIAQQSGTAEKTLYNIFGAKDRLVALAAHDRSASVFDLAARRSGGQGWALLRAFCATAAQATLEAPLLSRALAALLADHADLVGLHEVYEERVGAIMRDIVKDGQLDPAAPLGQLVRSIRLAVVSVVLFWAKGEIADGELEAYMARRCAETLLAFATDQGVAVFRAEILAATRVQEHAGQALPVL